MDFEHVRALGHMAQQESEITKLRKDLKTISLINLHQSNPMVHELTCGNDDCQRPTGGKLVPYWDGSVKMRCPDCDYIQTFIPRYFCEE